MNSTFHDAKRAKLLRRRSRLAAAIARATADAEAETLRVAGLFHEIHRDLRGAKR